MPEPTFAEALGRRPTFALSPTQKVTDATGGAGGSGLRVCLLPDPMWDTPEGDSAPRASVYASWEPSSAAARTSATLTRPSTSSRIPHLATAAWQARRHCFEQKRLGLPGCGSRLNAVEHQRQVAPSDVLPGVGPSLRSPPGNPSAPSSNSRQTSVMVPSAITHPKKGAGRPR